MESHKQAVSPLKPEARFLRRLRRVQPKAAVALIGAAAVLASAAPAEAQCLQCNASSETSSCNASGAWAFCCVPGFILANDVGDTSASASMTLGTNSLQFTQTINSTGCCTAPYANIGIFDACQQSDQYGQPGSHLPIQLKNLALLKAAWTFQVPVPLKASEQYRVYYEIFLSTTAAGHTDGGNLTGVVFWSNFGFDPATGHAPINGPQGMDMIDYHGTVGQGQGPFVDFLYPQGTFPMDSKGVVTVPSVDIKAILDYAVANYPNYYTNNLYLSSLSLAVEAGVFNGTITTSYASFAVQATGSPVVYTPAFTADHWSNCTTAGCSDAGVSPPIDAGGGSGGGAADASSGTGGSSSGGRAGSSGGKGGSSGGAGGSSGAAGASSGGAGASSGGAGASGGPSSGGGGVSSGGAGGPGGGPSGSSGGAGSNGGGNSGGDMPDATVGGQGSGADWSTGSKGSGCTMATAGSRHTGIFEALGLLGLASVARRRLRRKPQGVSSAARIKR